MVMRLWRIEKFEGCAGMQLDSAAPVGTVSHKCGEERDRQLTSVVARMLRLQGGIVRRSRWVGHAPFLLQMR